MKSVQQELNKQKHMINLNDNTDNNNLICDQKPVINGTGSPEDNSSSSAFISNNNLILTNSQIQIDNNPSMNKNKFINFVTNPAVTSTEPQITETNPTVNRQVTKRKRKQKVESPNSKKICNRPEKRIDSIFKMTANITTKQVQHPPHHILINSSPNLQHTSGTDSSVDSNHNVLSLLPTENQSIPDPSNPLTSYINAVTVLGPITNNNAGSMSSIPTTPTNVIISTCIPPQSNLLAGINPPVGITHASNSTTISNSINHTNNFIVSTANTTSAQNQSSVLSINGINSSVSSSIPIVQSSLSSTTEHSIHQITANNISTGSNEVVMELRRKIEDLEHQLEDRTKETDQLRDRMTQARESIIRCLISQTETERREAREKLLRDSIQLGSFRAVRQGALVEEKWIAGQLYNQLDQRREQLEQDRESYERDKKSYQRAKKTNVGSGSISAEVHQQQADILESRKNSLNKRDKELQEYADRLDRDRLLHIRETKRIQNEEGSRFRKFPILNERYLMLSLLGKGGFSEVFKAFDLDKFTLVACKVHELNSNWPQEKKDSYIRHALREIEIHKKLQHPRIVSVLDVFNIDSDAFCTVLEYCEGSDLDFFLKHNRSLGEKEARCIISQVVSALRYLNVRRNPVIHYDLKPGNILLCRRDCQIKITDFGLSKIFPDNRCGNRGGGGAGGLGSDEDGMELTSQGAGTYWYLPPECFVTDNGPPTISNKVDVWSVGVIFYQCLYGKKPFGDNETQTDILHNNTILQARSINFPTNPKVSDVAKDFIRKCCTYRKELRPDVFQLYNDDYLKSKTQLKYAVDLPNLPGPLILNNIMSNASGSA